MVEAFGQKMEFTCIEKDGKKVIVPKNLNPNSKFVGEMEKMFSAKVVEEKTKEVSKGTSLYK